MAVGCEEVKSRLRSLCWPALCTAQSDRGERDGGARVCKDKAPNLAAWWGRAVLPDAQGRGRGSKSVPDSCQYLQQKVTGRRRCRKESSWTRSLFCQIGGGVKVVRSLEALPRVMTSQRQTRDHRITGAT